MNLGNSFGTEEESYTRPHAFQQSLRSKNVLVFYPKEEEGERALRQQERAVLRALKLASFLLHQPIRLTFSASALLIFWATIGSPVPSGGHMLNVQQHPWLLLTGV